MQYDPSWGPHYYVYMLSLGHIFNFYSLFYYSFANDTQTSFFPSPNASSVTDSVVSWLCVCGCGIIFSN